MDDPRDLRTEAQIGGLSTVIDLPRIRLTVMSTHLEDELRAAAQTLAGAARSVGFNPRAPLEAAEPEAAQDGEAPAPEERSPELSPYGGKGVFDFEAPEPVSRAA